MAKKRRSETTVENWAGARFVVYARMDDVSRVLQDALSREGRAYQVDRELGLVHVDNELRISVEPEAPHRTLVTVVHVSGDRRTLWMWFAVALAMLLLALGLAVVTRSTSVGVFWATIGATLVGGGLAALVNFDSKRRRAWRKENALIQAVAGELAAEYDVKQLSPIDLWSARNAALRLSGAIAIALGFAALISFTLGAELLEESAIFGFSIAACTPLILSPRTLGAWRASLARFLSTWVILGPMLALFLLALSGLSTVVWHVGQSTLETREAIDQLKRASFARLFESYREWAREGAGTDGREAGRSLWRALSRRRPADDSDMLRRAESIRSARRAAIVLIGAGILFALLGQGLFWRELRSWRRYRLGGQNAAPVPVMPNEERLPVPGFAILVIFLIVCGGWMWFGSAVSIDLVSFVFGGDPIVLSQLGATLGLFEHVSTLAFGSLGRVSARLTLVALAFPFLIVLLLSGVRLARMVLREVSSALSFGLLDRRRGASSFPEQFAPSLKELMGRRIQIVEIQDDAITSATIWAEANVIIPGGTIRISNRTLEVLSDAELEALVAHEVFHLRFNARTIERLKLLSCLLLLPRNGLFLIYDFGRGEIEADRFAIEKAGSPEALRSALLKAATLQARTERSQGRRSLATGARAWWDALLGKGLYGAAYPTLRDRLHALAMLETQGNGR